METNLPGPEWPRDLKDGFKYAPSHGPEDRTRAFLGVLLGCFFVSLPASGAVYGMVSGDLSIFRDALIPCFTGIGSLMFFYFRKHKGQDDDPPIETL